MILKIDALVKTPKHLPEDIMATKIILVTGANTGLGLEIVKALCGSIAQYEILLGGRSLDKAKAAVSEIVTSFPSASGRVTAIQVDVEDDDSIAAAFDTVKNKYGRLDVLVNNAGALFDIEFLMGSMTMRQVWNQSWNVNITGSQIMTSVFIPLLLESDDPRLLFITSGTSTLAGSENLDLPINRVPPKGWPKGGPPPISIPAYRSSKAGMNMMMREWHRTLKEDGVKIWAISPGYLATGLGGSVEVNKKQGAADPAIGGQFAKDVIEGHRDDDVGKVILRDRVQPW
ncbi:Short-chain dehydrogenase/reductase tropE [Metarhizium brunneum]|uniref:Short-chain dehydrogenase/reductase tropE n=1 Tax=Metarhizium brunneum TaxID=500148 RepID=A0A7D5Z427_9HYPO